MYANFLTWARSEQRRGVEIPAIAYRQDGTRMGVLVSDLSYEGCRLAVNREVWTDKQITLVVFELGAEIDATVCWAAEGKVGLRFGEVRRSTGSIGEIVPADACSQ